PWDRAEVFEPPAGATARRPGRDAQTAQLFDRADPKEPFLESGCVDQGAIRRARWAFDPGGQLTKAPRRICPRPACDRGLEHRGSDLLEVAAGDGRVAVAREDHLALLGDLEVACHRAGSLRADRAVGGTAAPSQGAAASVKQCEPEAMMLR